jgi:Domain of Unknown Function (DUF1080)
MVRCLFVVFTLVLGGVAMTAQSGGGGAVNRLTAEEQAAGWRLLFDGQTTKGWRGFAKPAGTINGWIVENGRLRHPAKAGEDSKGSGDIVTIATFNDFDLRFEWVISPGGNSGVKYLVVENRDGPIAHEYQVIDDAKHPDALIGPHRSTGALYDVISAPASKPLKPAGQVNAGRILLNGNHVEHWLNGVKIVEYELGSSLRPLKEKSKFKDVPGWEDKLKGHILLQDHGDEVAFFNVKIRELSQSTRQ